MLGAFAYRILLTELRLFAIVVLALGLIVLSGIWIASEFIED